MRELLTRFERRTVAMERRLDAQTDVLRTLTREIEDARGEIPAQTQAILRVLDELGGGGPATA